MLVKNLTKYKLLPFIVALAIAIIVPLVVEAQADETKVEESVAVSQTTDESEKPFVAHTQTEVETEPVPTPTPTDEEQPVLPEEEVLVEEPVDEPVDTPTDEDPITDITESFDRYVAFAQAEHPGVEIASVKFVWKHGVKSAKVTFVDGWRVFIGVSDGSTLKIADEDGEVKKCQPRVSRKKAFKRWYKTHNSYYEWWKSKQPVEETPAEEDSTDENSTQQEASVEASASTKVRSTSTKSYYKSGYKNSYRW